MAPATLFISVLSVDGALKSNEWVRDMRDHPVVLHQHGGTIDDVPFAGCLLRTLPHTPATLIGSLILIDMHRDVHGEHAKEKRNSKVT